MKKKILLIEDDLLFCRACQQQLEEAGYEVECALDGEQGLEKSKDGYDCVLLDISLPKLDGWQVLEELRSRDGTRHLLVVVCTVLDGDHYREEARRLGADSFVNKFKDDVVLELERVLGGGFKGNLH